MKKFLIIKLGALGDVVRTTPILRALRGEVTWVTQRAALPLLRGIPQIKKLLAIEDLKAKPGFPHFDCVLNLEENPRALALVQRLSYDKLVGCFAQDGRATYTDDAAPWYDMSLISRLGKSRADQLKWLNKKTYPEILFAMMGLKFNGEEYVLPPKILNRKIALKYDVGLECRSGERWMAKRWPYAQDLGALFDKKDISHFAFEEYSTLEKFMEKIKSCRVVVTTDSLAMHLALGLKRRVVALFTCTSAHEIEGFDRMVQLKSPLLQKYFYSTQKTLIPGQAIAVSTVYKAVQKCLR